MTTIVNGIELFYEKVGQGKPILMIHGNQEDHQIFFELADSLKNHYSCYLVDSRNHGRSTKTDNFHYKAMAKDYIALMKQLHLESPYLIGYSDGGIIGLMIALMEPKLLQKMVICGANIHPRGIKKKEREMMISELIKNDNPYLRMMIEEPNISFHTLKKISTKTLLIAGEYDVITPRHTHAMHRHIPSSQLIIMQKKHHDDYLVHRDDLKQTIIEFFH